MLPYFLRAEGNTRLGGPFHGQDGPLHVEDRRYTHELTDAWVESAVAAGIKPQRRLQRRRPGGRRALPGHLPEGSPLVDRADAYLDPAADRPNLTVRTGALVERVVVEGGRAVGVQPTSTARGARRRTPPPR